MNKLFVDLFETGLKDITEPTLPMPPMPEVPKGPKGPTPKTNYPRYIPLTQPKIELQQTKTFYPKYTKIDIEPPKIEGPIKVKLLYHSGEEPQRIRALVRERMPTQPIEQEPIPIGSPYFGDTELPEEAFKLPAGSLDEFKTRFDTHIKKLKSIEFKIPTQLKEIYLDLVAKLENILNYIESVAVGLFAELVEYIGRFIQWLTGPTQRTAEDILIEIKDVNETVELVENVIKK